MNPTWKSIKQSQRAFFLRGQTRNYKSRKHALKQLLKGLIAFEEAIIQAMSADLGRPALEAYGTEVGVVKEEVKFALNNLRSWMQPEVVSTPQKLLFWSKSRVEPQPLGQVLIIAPWNYPVFLTLTPLIGVLSAGNTAILKPSEFTPNTSQVLADLINQYLPNWCSVVQGGKEIATELLQEPWDHILFTGSERTAKLVLAAAAQTLSPVTLELGGKCPVVVDKSANIKVAARRIAFAKWLNAGQTCLAPDHVWIHREIYSAFKEELVQALNKFGGGNPLTSDLTKQIHEEHFKRQLGFLKNADLVWGGVHDGDRHLSISVIENTGLEHPSMQEEIFGPVLPLLPYESHHALVAHFQNLPKPLAFYLFTSNNSLAKYYRTETQSGSLAVNEVLLQTANPEFPFGGVGNSGMGAYRGKYGFKTFSHFKPVLKSYPFTDLPFRYPPYKGKLKWLKHLLG